MLTLAAHKANDFVTLPKMSRVKWDSNKVVNNTDNAYDNCKFNYKDNKKNMHKALIKTSIPIVEMTNF